MSSGEELCRWRRNRDEIAGPAETDGGICGQNSDHTCRAAQRGSLEPMAGRVHSYGFGGGGLFVSVTPRRSIIVKVVITLLTPSSLVMAMPLRNPTVP